jgi:hypothetical protein
MRFMLIETMGAGAGSPRAMDAPERARYEQALARAGILLACERLRPRQASGGAELAGFWLIEVKSREEAEEWARRAGSGGGIEIREAV